jgi:pimeloyl-ACP methyl ester carboxylesterase
VAQTWSESAVEVAGGQVELLTGGSGQPLVVLHHDIGNSGWLPFYDALARQFSVYVPSHPGYGKSERLDWMRSVRDLAIVHQWLVKDLKLDKPCLVGLGFGGWLAAEMASMSPSQYRRLVLVGAMGIKPTEGEIVDQFLLYTTDYIQSGFFDAAAYEAQFGNEPDIDQLVAWEIHREMTTRIAWKPYMFNPGLPHLLGGVETPTLVVWGKHDRIVPLNCGEQYVKALPNARLTVLDECGHFADMEKAEELAGAVGDFLSE